jgi:hypothetical protein
MGRAPIHRGDRKVMWVRFPPWAPRYLIINF